MTVMSTLTAMHRGRAMTTVEAMRLVPCTIAAASIASLGIAAVQRVVQPHSEFGRPIVTWTAVALAVALALFVAGKVIGPTLPRVAEDRTVTAYVLALQAGILLVPVAAFAAVWKNEYDTFTGWTYPYLNKRWLVALYGIGVATFLLFPPAIDRWLSGRDSSVTVDPPKIASTRSWWRHAGGILVLVAVAWYFTAPPWNVERHHRAIDFHEQVHLGPLQAIDKGYLPYVGPASTQYGPGSQLLTYAWMKSRGHFDIVSFREAQIVFHAIAFGTVALLGYLVAGLWGMLAILAFGLSYSPLTFFFVGSDGTFGGSYGWGNELRYLGPLIVAPGLAHAAVRIRPTQSLEWRAVAFGAVWGLFSWISQENLGTTLVASTLVLLIMWATATVPGRSIAVAALGALGGFATIAATVLAYYAAHGAAQAFARAYFLVASAVAMGFQNVWWNPGEAPGHYNAYRFTAPFLVALGTTALIDFPRFAFRRHLDERRVLFLALVCVQLACYQTSLYRSDYTHLMNTMLALPFVLVLALRDVPRWMARTWPARAGLTAVIAALILVIYPIGHVLRDPLGWVLRPPASRFATRVPEQGAVRDGRIPFRRATRWLTDEPQTAPGMVPMRTFLEAGSGIRDLIGTRRTYVDGVVAGAYTGLYYFMLDLTPGPALFEKETMTIHDGIATEAFNHFRAHAAEFDAVLTATPESREALAFRAAHPGAVAIQRAIGATPVFVLLSTQS
jgi:hypothetical protein